MLSPDVGLFFGIFLNGVFNFLDSQIIDIHKVKLLMHNTDYGNFFEARSHYKVVNISLNLRQASCILNERACACQKCTWNINFSF